MIAARMNRMLFASALSSAKMLPQLRCFASAADKLIYIKDDATYHELRKGDKPCIMNFSASWCRPCKMMAPMFAQLSATNDHVNFVKIDVDASPKLSNEEKITSVPTYKLYKADKLISQFAGADVNQLQIMIGQAKSA
ncbi:Thioredoxin [Blastocystis hominis]|uniref:Thioredoxin n=1 Tax=Blastocystis hominis TaxID=12968 RepID=D8M673_BLAHO|nr:Thioredoxin [Blastocystis hominis]CBK23782.2 Thioredoxin [Blastocystis hominis]|eukprot:XP_012897830.1 Thioredoxin [Blastocystis hominis]